MNLKDLLGDAYQEGMSLQDVETALNGKKLVDLSTGNYIDKNKYDREVNDLTSKLTAKSNELQSKLTDDEKKANEDKARDELIEKLQEQIKNQGIENNKSTANALTSETKGLLGIKEGDKDFTSFVDVITKGSKEDTTSVAGYFAKCVKDAYEKGKSDATKNSMGNMGKQKASGTTGSADNNYGKQLAERVKSSAKDFSYFGKYNK